MAREGVMEFAELAEGVQLNAQFSTEQPCGKIHLSNTRVLVVLISAQSRSQNVEDMPVARREG